ncbi:hypothetical protein B0H65DRAFT_540176 [Neurospora tetraspora]|uniref:Uncharacterized protein n=1 Tax=Neurospora tetraspora TaxID=94610 RepID=A0AAE0JCV3_9PEZI|nr:hypothetical protein B0H65DRAFT_540176 [Neurospora tetraspora]
MQIISVLTALVAFKLAAALPSGPDTGVVTHVDSADIPAAYKVFNKTDIATRDLDKRATLVKLDSTLAGRVSAVGPDQGTYCRFFFSSNCVDTSSNNCEHFDDVYPGHALHLDLSSLQLLTARSWYRGILEA